MKKLRFESLELLSRKEGKARKIEFHPRLTVIQGENDVGKSSVIKSLYWTFGATPPKFHSSWKSANVKALVTFTIDGVRYRILRDQDTFGIFDANGDLLLSTNQVGRELAPYLSKLINFKLVLTNRNGEPEFPPPAFAFLPFYIDQDAGWGKPLDSFARLTQFTDFRRELLEFHIGIFPNEYYELSADKRSLQVDQKALEADRRIVRKAIERFNLEASFDGLELSTEGHEQAIEKMLVRLQKVRQRRQERAAKLTEILDQRMMLDQQVLVVRASIAEFEKDAKFAGDIAEEEIFCPTCGTLHRNDFANRFSIVEDREACFNFLADANQKLRILTSQAVEAEAGLHGADEILSEIQVSLEAKQGDVNLLDVIESHGRRVASEIFVGQIDDLDAQIVEHLGKISEIEEKIDELKDEKRRNDIVKYYSGFILKYLDRLDVTNYTADDYTRIPARIGETGSDLPRALLAYFLAILKTVHKHSTALFAPIVIDSPNQQDQDPKNVGAMIDLITSSRPEDAQTILGTVSLHGREIMDGELIVLTDKLSVMRPSDYETISSSMKPYMDQLIA